MDKYLSVDLRKVVKIERLCRGRMCTCTGANYGAVCKPIWISFYTGTPTCPLYPVKFSDQYLQ